jgi:hypothetical protein
MIKDYKITVQITLTVETFAESQEDAELKVREEIAEDLWPRDYSWEQLSIEEVVKSES